MEPISAAVTTPTLDTIKAEQSRLAAMIATFEAQQLTRTVDLPATTITLQPGEHYAGIVLGQDGEQSYHLILLSGAAEEVNWQDAQEWAIEASGELPTRREQALLYANLKDQFENAWYWSAHQRESDPDYVWCQDFGDGNQITGTRDYELRARAVRRLIIS